MLGKGARVLGAGIFLLRAVFSGRFRAQIRAAAADVAEARHAMEAIVARMHRERSGNEPAARLVYAERPDAGSLDKPT